MDYFGDIMLQMSRAFLGWTLQFYSGQNIETITTTKISQCIIIPHLRQKYALSLTIIILIVDQYEHITLETMWDSSYQNTN